MTARDLTEFAHRDAQWGQLRAVIAGLGVSGFAMADALLQRGAQVTVVDDRQNSIVSDRAEILRIMGATVWLNTAATQNLPQEQFDVFLCSPGWRPDHPLVRAATARGLPIWGDIELAWRMRAAGGPEWITVTGTNGKTSTVQLLTTMLQAAGMRAEAVGNIGTPVLDALAHPEQPDVLVVELSSFQLHWASTDPVGCVSALASAVLNVAPDHVDWHAGYPEYAAAKGKIYEQTSKICVYNVQDSKTEELLRAAEVVSGARAVGFTLGIPMVGMVGVVDDVLADRAFIDQRQTNAAQLATLADVQGAAGVLAPHQVANALAAAALARAAGAPPAAIRQGLRGFTPQPHRITEVAVVQQVRFIDDSKATNPPAAAAALSAFSEVVWLAGGLLKGANVDDLVRAHGAKLRAAVIFGQDRAAFRTALAKYAPQVPIVELAETTPEVIRLAVSAAIAAAQPGDTVLLAPAAASMDIFDDYAHRGTLFSQAVRAHARGEL